MEDTPSKRASGLPRPSKLPLARPTSGLPKPTSTLPRPNSTIRPSASRDSLHGASPVRSETPSELKVQRLRASASRDQLSSNINQGRNPRLRASASRDQLISRKTSRESFSKPPPISSFNNGRASATPQRRTSTALPEATPSDEGARVDSGPPEDEVLFKRRLTLTRRPSESFPGPLFPEESESAGPAGDYTDTLYESVKATPSKPRPSLSERTMETLAGIPSSPALTKKPSSFFEQGRPKSRRESTTSRPGSSYNSDGSGRASSRAGSRPGSSGRPEDTNFRASTNTFKAPLSTIHGTPRSRGSLIQPPQTPVVRKTASRVSLNTASKLPASAIAAPAETRTPSPGKKTYGGLPKAGSKTVASRPSKDRASLGGVFKKPSLPALNLAAANGDSTRNASENSVQSSNGSWDGTIPSTSSVASASTGLTDAAASPSSNRKSSAALRDQIAKAKAAKRATMRQSTSAQETMGNEVSIVPSDDGFDFGMVHADPFNLNKGANPKQKVLQQKISAARASGRLNIAALDLKEIPVEVMKMYDFESIGAGGNWAESVDLTRFVAADNELETLDDFIFPDSEPGNPEDEGQGNIFGGLETLDMHGNLLIGVPLGFRRLTHLTSLNLSSNRLQNNSLDTIAQMSSLRDLKLAKNLFFGPLPPELSNLSALEILDLHGNNISALPRGIEKMSRLRIINLNENSMETLSSEGLAQLPLTELLLRKNKLSGTLIEGADCFPQLQTLDASMNQLQRLVPLGATISLPVLHALSLSMNRLLGLPDLEACPSLLTLCVDENSIAAIPNSFTTLTKLRHADFSSNDIRVIPPEIARMDNLSMIRLSGNPLRDKKFVSIPTDELKEALSARLEPPPAYQDVVAPQPAVPGFLMEAKAEMAQQQQQQQPDAEDDSLDDDFATPPTSIHGSPNRSRSATVSSLRSRSQTLSNQTWPVKQGGILDRSRTESSSLHPVVCSKVAADNRIKQVMLNHNLFSSFPNSLSFFAETLSVLSLASNQLVGETYITEQMDFPALRELNVSGNRITGLEPFVKYLHAPVLEKLDVSMNRVNSLPIGLKETFPQLTILLGANNQIANLDPDMIKGLKIVDVSSNDISKLDPKIGLLGGAGGLERLEVMGNRFKVPRYNVLERGTDATLRWLRGRVPVAELAAWRGNNDEGGISDVD